MCDSVITTLHNNGVFLEDNNKFYLDMVSCYEKHFDKGIIEPTCDNLVETIKQLIDNGAVLSVVTTDNPTVTKKCLDILGVSNLFENVFCDDGVIPAKPDPYCINLLSEKYGVDKQNIYMVGDTINDVKFAKNGQIKCFGLAKSIVNKEILQKYTDYVIDDISQLLTVIK
jgi:phosphoglycolate phosphatase/HAD superfamily phosphatase